MKQAFIGVIIFGILSALFVIGSRIWNNGQPVQVAGLKVTSISPTPFPFKELTIPYLRGKTYESSLGEREQVYDYGQYTGYMTDYTSDGLKVKGLLTIPKGDKPKSGWPAIVFIHGYIPPTQYNTLEKYIAYVHHLASSDFVVFKIDLRGHGTSEGEAGGGYYGSDYVTDALNAHSALASSGFVDSKGIGLWGHSMAGNTVLRAMAVKPEIPAGVIWAGAVYTYEDMQKYGIQDASYQRTPSNTQRRRRQQLIFDTYGRPGEGNAFWKQVAPTNYLADLKGAIQIHHAIDDGTVNIGYSRDLNALLDKTSVSHELIEYPSGGHNISDPSFSQAIENTAEFFRENLPSD
jgi:uncharacterized protein